MEKERKGERGGRRGGERRKGRWDSPEFSGLQSFWPERKGLFAQCSDHQSGCLFCRQHHCCYTAWGLGQTDGNGVFCVPAWGPSLVVQPSSPGLVLERQSGLSPSTGLASTPSLHLGPGTLQEGRWETPPVWPYFEICFLPKTFCSCVMFRVLRELPHAFCPGRLAAFMGRVGITLTPIWPEPKLHQLVLILCIVLSLCIFVH